MPLKLKLKLIYCGWSVGQFVLVSASFEADDQILNFVEWQLLPFFFT
jgi:hypothetical protein